MAVAQPTFQPADPALCRLPRVVPGQEVSLTLP